MNGNRSIDVIYLSLARMEFQNRSKDGIICRTCLNDDSGEYTSLSSCIEIVPQHIDLQNTMPTISECLDYCLHSEPMKTSALPQYICRECVNCLTSSYKFIAMAKDAEIKLRAQCTDGFMQYGDGNIERMQSQESQTIEIEYVHSAHVDTNLETVFDEVPGIMAYEDEKLRFVEAEEEGDSSDSAILENSTEFEGLKKYIQDIKTTKNQGLPHQCEICAFETNSSFNLRRHYEGVHKTLPSAEKICCKESDTDTTNANKSPIKSVAVCHKCEVCNKVLKSSYLLECHLNKHKGVAPYKCQLCCYECRYQNNIRRHYKLKHALIPNANMLKQCAANSSAGEKREYACTQCQFRGESYEEFRQHKIQHHDFSELNPSSSTLGETEPFDAYRFMCSKCSKKFKMMHVLKTHERICLSRTDGSDAKDADEVDKPFECPQCPSRFSILEYLQTHLTVVHRARIHQCKVCEKNFKLPSQLNNHMARHQAIRSYKCDQCTRSYISQAELNVHRRVHTGELPYSCDFCTQNFRNADRLAVHRNKEHLHTKFHCSQCSEEFESKAKLQLHRYKHSNMPYKCDVCLKEFDKRHHIRRHMVGVHHIKISEEQLATMFMLNTKRTNRFDVFNLGNKFKPS